VSVVARAVHQPQNSKRKEDEASHERSVN
jgi:hypothetical protein